MEALLQSPITLALLLLNVGISGYALGIDPSLIDELSFRPHRIENRGEYYRFLTAGFVHAGGAHLAFNMITLYFFGPQLERVLGAGAFLVLYFGSEMTAHLLTSPIAPTRATRPSGPPAPSAGCSSDSASTLRSRCSASC